jgi:guanylate kinase
MTKPLYLFIGRSASGKTTVAEILEKSFNCKSVQSYTTRPKRRDNETGHTFITDEEFAELRDIVAYNVYNGYQYCATSHQLDESDIYVVDIPGLEKLLSSYSNINRPLRVVYFDASVYARINRMIDRGDSYEGVVQRLLQDEESDWGEQTNKLVWHHKNNLGRDIDLRIINADQNIVQVSAQVKEYMAAG